MVGSVGGFDPYMRYLFIIIYIYTYIFICLFTSIHISSILMKNTWVSRNKLLKFLFPLRNFDNVSQQVKFSSMGIHVQKCVVGICLVRITANQQIISTPPKANVSPEKGTI